MTRVRTTEKDELLLAVEETLLIDDQYGRKFPTSE